MCFLVSCTVMRVASTSDSTFGTRGTTFLSNDLAVLYTPTRYAAWMHSAIAEIRTNAAMVQSKKVCSPIIDVRSDSFGCFFALLQSVPIGLLSGFESCRNLVLLLGDQVFAFLQDI